MRKKAKTQHAILQFWWPTLHNKAAARFAAMQGYWAALIGATVTAFFAVLSWYGFTPIRGFDIYALFDAMLLCILAWGIEKMSRTAAVIALVYFIVSKLLMFAANGLMGISLLIAVVFGLLYVNGMRGTFGYWKLKK